MIHVYYGILFSRKKNEIMPFTAAWMELEIIVLMSQTERDKYDIIYMWNLIYAPS